MVALASTAESTPTPRTGSACIEPKKEGKLITIPVEILHEEPTHWPNRVILSLLRANMIQGASLTSIQGPRHETLEVEIRG
jgi:hypothetical protein